MSESTDALPPKFDPAAVEAEVYALWLAEDCFKADPTKAGEPYSIVIPPPNVTGALHLGHAINNTLQDILTRVHRMRGFNVVWIPGIDHAGIATQAVVEKQLKEKENKTRHDVGREALVARIWEWKQQYGDRILSQLQRLGCSCDWSRTRFTLDDMCARAVRETFFKLFKDGLIYRGKRLVNWDTHLLTSISDDELYDEPVKTNLWSIRYPIESSTGVSPVESNHGRDAHATFMTVATTRPETMLADTAVAVHPDDPRWNWAIGKQVRLPLTNRLIPIIGDPILVDMSFGSGVVKVTPAHDPNDYAVYTRHLGQPTEIAILNMMTPDGKVNDADPSWSQYTGLTFAAARKKIIEDLTAGGFHNPETDVKPHEANVKFSDRSKTAIQPYLSDQWFVKMAPLAEPALQVVRDGTIKFFPERHAQQYLSWLGEKRDWPISRQLWWGHRIPIWTLVDVSGQTAEWTSDFHIPKLIPKDEYVLFYDDELDGLFGSNPKNCSLILCYAGTDKRVLDKLAEIGFTQDPDVLDTWFSSALWPHSTLGWPDSTADLGKWYPTSVLMTGRDIITLWVARMVMMGMYNMGQRPTGPYSCWTYRCKLTTQTRGEFFFNVPAGTDAYYIADAETGQRVDPHFFPEIVPPEAERDYITYLYTTNPGPELTKFGFSQLAELPGPWPTSTLGWPKSDAARVLGIPFHHVAINPTILDGKGERMSKSKGNGVDPVDIIDTHGADALRFTLTTMATETQDVRLPVKKDAQGRNTSDKFDLGRNFCTKLWNAARFVMTNLDTVKPRPVVASDGVDTQDATNGRGFTLADRWIVSRFNRAVEDSNSAIAAYRFDQYAKACYDFFWRDFCDWYLEAAKPAMKDPARSKATSVILTSMLDGALRLMHPIIPFITERLWWKLHPGQKLISAEWPKSESIDTTAEETFTKLQDVIAAIRTVRNDYKIDPKKPVAVTFSAPENLKVEIEQNRELIETLAVCTIGQIGTNLTPPSDSARASAAGVDIFVAGVIDPEAEKNRKSKQIEMTNQKISALKARLANPSYADKAPPHLVQQTRDELAALEQELKKLEG